jgi:hypothetical protein
MMDKQESGRSQATGAMTVEGVKKAAQAGSVR